MTKIVIPSSPKKVLELAQKILDKHVADGASSPISAVVQEDLQQKITDALQLHNEAETLEKEIEKKYDDRDLLLKEIVKSIRQSRDVLKGIHPDNLRQLGDYGFTVND